MLNLTGIGWTENFGTAVIRNILSPLLIGEKGLPWAAPGRAVREATIGCCLSLRREGLDDEQIFASDAQGLLVFLVYLVYLVRLAELG